MIGSHSMVKRTVLGLFVVAVLLVSMAPAWSIAAPYSVAQCQTGTAQEPIWDSSLMVFSTNRPGDWIQTNRCVPRYERYFGRQVGTKLSTYTAGDVARYRMSVPAGLGITAVEGMTNNQIGYGWSGDRILHNNGADPVLISASPLDDFSYSLPSGEQRTDFELRLKCGNATCPGGSLNAYIELASVKMTVVDNLQPGIIQVGNLFSGGVVSGTRTAELTGADTGSGVKSLLMLINGQWVSPGANAVCDLPQKGSFATYRPCPLVEEKTPVFNTAQAPFVEGTNYVASCAFDFGGNAACTPSSTVYVDN